MSINHWFALIPSVFIQVSLHGQILNSNDCPSTLRSQKFHCICQLLLAWFLAFCSVQLKNKQTSPGEIWGRMNDKNVTITSVSPPSLLDLHPSNLWLLLFSHSFVSNSFHPHGLQHSRLLCLPLSAGVSSNLCQLSQWCYLSISSSAVPFCLQSFPASGSFPTSQLFT